MEWQGEALILAARPHGEGSAIVDVFTRAEGRHAGLIRGGFGRRLRPLLQPGNMAQIGWRARLSEHLGTMTIEGGRAHGAELMSDRRALAGLSSLCALLMITPERQAYPRLYDTVQVLLQAFDDEHIWLPLLVRFELALLEETGFGLDMSACAATGSQDNLTHISPRSGRAVSAAAATPYLDRLFALPAFLRDPQAAANNADIAAGFELTGYFLERRVYQPVGKTLPQARQRLLDVLHR